MMVVVIVVMVILNFGLRCDRAFNLLLGLIDFFLNLSPKFLSLFHPDLSFCLTNHFVEFAADVRGITAGMDEKLPDMPHHFREALWPDKNQNNSSDNKEFHRSNAKQ